MTGSRDPSWTFSGTIDLPWHELPVDVVDFYIADNRERVAERSDCRELHRPHIAASRERVAENIEAALRCAPADEPCRAIVAAVGNNSDTLVAQMRDFDEIVLTDSDPVALERVRTRLPDDVAGKVVLRATDLAGTTGAFLSDMKYVADNSSTYEEFYTSATPFVDEHANRAPRLPNLGSGYAFVCSQLAMSQLASAATEYIDSRILHPNYEVLPSQEPDAPEHEYVQALVRLADVRHRRHIAQLSGLVARTGIVHLADTYVELDATGKPVGAVIDQAATDAQINRYFAMHTPPREWEWRTSPTHGFKVVAHSLAPRGV